MGVRGDWPNRHITFIVAKKSFICRLFCLFTVYVERGVGWKSHMGEGLAENVRIPSYGGRGSKIA